MDSKALKIFDIPLVLETNISLFCSQHKISRGIYGEWQVKIDRQAIDSLSAY